MVLSLFGMVNLVHSIWFVNFHNSYFFYKLTNGNIFLKKHKRNLLKRVKYRRKRVKYRLNINNDNILKSTLYTWITLLTTLMLHFFTNKGWINDFWVSVVVIAHHKQMVTKELTYININYLVQVEKHVTQQLYAMIRTTNINDKS